MSEELTVVSTTDVWVWRCDCGTASAHATEEQAGRDLFGHLHAGAAVVIRMIPAGSTVDALALLAEMTGEAAAV